MPVPEYLITYPWGSLYLFMAKKRILVAPLNWGLGHATRCIPIVKALLDEGFEPVIASDGEALELLNLEFPFLESYGLPSYNIRYSKNAFFFRSKLLIQTPHILKTISKEKKITEELIKDKEINGIISDSRWGVRGNAVPSVFITHQVNVLSGFTTFLSSWIHHRLIQKFDECWVPDNEGIPNLSGKMGHPEENNLNLKYIGVLSRFKIKQLLVKYEIIVILSGPEPQRSLLEKLLLRELKGKDLKILFVRGKVEKEQKFIQDGNLKIYNYLTSNQLEGAINESSLVICRPGYTSLMDLAVLKKNVFLIPTPGQYEQEYLFERLYKKGLAAGSKQEKFTFDLLKEVRDKDLGIFASWTGPVGIFSLFKGE